MCCLRRCIMCLRTQNESQERINRCFPTIYMRNDFAGFLTRSASHFVRVVRFNFKVQKVEKVHQIALHFNPEMSMLAKRV